MDERTTGLDQRPDTLDLARDAQAFMTALFPICRSITGDGVRETLRQIGARIPLIVSEVPSGTQAFDWTVPREWNIRDAWVKNAAGDKVIDFARHNLHVVNYSTPLRARMTLAELRPHLHTLPEQPDVIPYRTSYYKDYWGFCLEHSRLQALPDGDYEVCIDSTLADGSLTYAECVLPGASDEEVLVSTHICHPSLANDNLSGIALVTLLADQLGRLGRRRYTYRFLFIPGTIGSIVWLARNPDCAGRVKHGPVITGLGDPGDSTYKQSRRGDAPIDGIAAHVLKQRGAHRIVPFTPYGYDERQFCSPGFNLPMGCLTRSTYGSYPQYHTSGDNLELLRPDKLADSLDKLFDIVDILERDAVYVNLNPHCEPQLGKRGLYGALGGASDTERMQMALLWVLNLSDGGHSLLDIAERAGLPFAMIDRAARLLQASGLLQTNRSPA